MRKVTVYDQVALIALAGESMVCYIALHNVVQLDVIASLLGLVFNSSVLSFLYCHSFRRVLTGSIKPNETVMPKETDRHPFPDDDNHIIILKEREERELKTIDAVFNYTMHYIGRYLTLEERGLLRENIIIFSFDKEEELHPVIENKFGDFNLYDITHLCHAIGNHTVSRKNIYQIASFAKACFPAYTNGQHMHSIAAKLTNTDRATIIPVLRRNDPLPDFSEM
ncbi:MAG: hypothetical protein J6I32_01900 [Bacteroidaceae bacterium]|nr:hypothetical protein [Bacteroidaceae bacterium]